MATPQGLPRDGNNNPIQFADGVVVTKTITFDGGTTNGIGDENGTNDPFTIFTVTGNVLLKVYGVCTTLLAGATATVEVGVTGNTAALIALTTATDIDANEIWRSATPDVGTVAFSNITQFIVANGLDILGEVKTANITSGVIDFIGIYIPLSEDAQVVEG